MTIRILDVARLRPLGQTARVEAVGAVMEFVAEIENQTEQKDHGWGELVRPLTSIGARVRPGLIGFLAEVPCHASVAGAVPLPTIVPALRSMDFRSCVAIELAHGVRSGISSTCDRRPE